MKRTYDVSVLVVVGCIVLAAVLQAPRGYAQDTVNPDGPPFSLPFDAPPGPNTWLYEQHYGNTQSAFNYGSTWYLYGQGMHFGIDLEAPCGTPVHAIADGVVAYVDGEGFGAGPHNLVVKHPGTGLASLYGHLLREPELVRGQEVQRGDVIGLSGDPDLSCESRPHLHLEIRSDDYQVAYNPIFFFDENWHMLASVTSGANSFQQDLDAPYRWMRLEDQPSINFSSLQLNRYQNPWPPKLEQRAPVNPPTDRRLDPLPDDVTVIQTPVALDRWAINAWWDPADPDAVYLIDSVPGQGTGVFRQPLDGTLRQYIEGAPPSILSPDGDVSVRRLPDASFAITDRRTGDVNTIITDGNYPAVSPGGEYLLWEVLGGEIVPGEAPPSLQVWISNLDGSERRHVYSQAGGWSMWLDDHRLLLVQRGQLSAKTTLSVLDISARGTLPQELGTYRWLHGIQVSPGGDYLAFYLAFQDDPDDSGLYVLRTRPGAEAQPLPVFGATRWRDDRSLFVLSYDAQTDVHTLGVVDVRRREYRALTDPDDLPLRVANGDWSVSPDGTRIVYVDPTDYGLYLLTITPEDE